MKELTRRWIEALRSGRYEQTTDTLRFGNGFCCLGVACDVINPDAWTPLSEMPGEMCYEWEADNQRTLDVDLGQDELEALGITRAQQAELITMNDQGEPFSAIADRIEEYAS